MHRPGAGFILPNAWDGGSARILEQAGFAAIATTSAGIAFSRGAADGTMDRSEMLDCIARIVSAVACPVSADLESGYGTTADDVAATVAAAVKLGVVGGNLEDVTRPGELLPVEAACERLEAARTAAPAGSFVLNARTDAYMIRHPDAFAETVRRAERYLAAGADCIFVPGVAAAEEIGRLTAAIGAPVNVVSGLVAPRAGRCHPALARRRQDQRWRHPHSRRPYPDRAGRSGDGGSRHLRFRPRRDPVRRAAAALQPLS